MDRKQFEILRDSIVEKTSYLSMVQPALDTPEYTELKNAGIHIVAFILKDMELSARTGTGTEGNFHWFYLELLQDLIGSEPEVPKEDYGKLWPLAKIYYNWALSFMNEYNRRKIEQEVLDILDEPTKATITIINDNQNKTCEISKEYEWGMTDKPNYPTEETFKKRHEHALEAAKTLAFTLLPQPEKGNK